MLPEYVQTIYTYIYHLGIYNYIDTRYRATILVSKPPEWKKVSQKVSLMQPMLSIWVTFCFPEEQLMRRELKKSDLLKKESLGEWLHVRRFQHLWRFLTHHLHVGRMFPVGWSGLVADGHSEMTSMMWSPYKAGTKTPYTSLTWLKNSGNIFPPEISLRNLQTYHFFNFWNLFKVGTV